MKNLRFLLVILLLGFLCQDVSAQFRYGYFRVGVSGGSTNYLGDLDDDLTFRFTKAGVGLSGSYRFNPFMTVRLGFYRGWVSAADSVSVNFARNRRNIHFRTPITEASLQFVFDFIPTERAYAFRPPYTPYVFAGIGVFSFNPQSKLDGVWYDLQPLGTEGQWLSGGGNRYPEPYQLTQVAIPMGAGVRLAITRRLDLELETGFRKLFTDYLDDTSGLYADIEQIRQEMGAEAAIFADPMDPVLYPEGGERTNGIRGDSTQADWYIYTAFRLNYILDWVRCPQFR